MGTEFIGLLTDSSKPGVVRIVSTLKEPHARLRELNRKEGGVYDLYAYWKVESLLENPRDAHILGLVSSKALIKEELYCERIGNSDCFKLEPHDAATQISLLLLINDVEGKTSEAVARAKNKKEEDRKKHYDNIRAEAVAVKNTEDSLKAAALQELENAKSYAKTVLHNELKAINLEIRLLPAAPERSITNGLLGCLGIQLATKLDKLLERKASVLERATESYNVAMEQKYAQYAMSFRTKKTLFDHSQRHRMSIQSYVDTLLRFLNIHDGT